MARRKKSDILPKLESLVISVIKALILLGGSGTIEEINEKVYEIENFPEEVLKIPHSEDGSQSEVDYTLAWARTYLKLFGLLENSARKVWALAKSDIDVNEIDGEEIVWTVRKQSSKAKIDKQTNKETQIPLVEEVVEEQLEWKEKLIQTILSISPNAFEKLAQRLLRESGFVEVEVTGRSGDEGIDGKGIVRMSGLLSFHVIFQCKRYKGSIVPSQIRDFRGAM